MDPSIKVEHLAGYARRMICPVPFVAETHVHKTDHWTILERGSVLVWNGLYEQRFTAPAAIFIRAGRAHRIDALTPDVSWLCLHTFPLGSEEAEVLGVTMDQVLVED